MVGTWPALVALVLAALLSVEVAHGGCEDRPLLQKIEAQLLESQKALFKVETF